MTSLQQREIVLASNDKSKAVMWQPPTVKYLQVSIGFRVKPNHLRVLRQCLHGRWFGCEFCKFDFPNGNPDGMIEC